jgi:hypothetical protein
MVLAILGSVASAITCTLACFEFVVFHKMIFETNTAFTFPFEYGLYFRLSTNRLFDMEILRSTDFVDYYLPSVSFDLV